ncbi:MAG: DHH family phosphoesterase [Proteobacteria bacterium]|nr:DHH family phosphoesterase [Pseudomonadota bacterium]
MNHARIVRRDSDAQGDWPADLHPVLRRIFAARGAHCMQAARPKLTDLLPPSALGGIDAASALLAEAIRGDRRIVVVGDFDCDGATGVAVGVRGLRLLGAQHVAYQVPQRMVHGYGLSPALVEAMQPLRPDLLVTVDNGIACVAGVAAARQRGWQVLVTDHHLPGAALPLADAIVDPNLLAFARCRHDLAQCAQCERDVRANAAFAGKSLAGVGVLFYLLLATRARLRDEGWFDASRREPDLSVLLDLVAVGTVADMVVLDVNNRALVAAGLRRLRAGRCQPGLRALAEVSGRALERLTSADIGFSIGPRINAAGRLEDMSVGIECLLTDDAEHALELARTLDGINRQRRQVQDQMLEEAIAIAAASVDSSSAGVCVHDEGWHAGVVGLVASKLKERLHRPVLAFAPAGSDSEEWRGSARSIPGFHIRDALAEIDTRHPGLILRFGGHAMAAGLGLARADLARFAAAFDALARERIAPELLEAVLLSDGELEPAATSLDLAQQLRDAGPWGQGFPEPLFDGRFTVMDWRVVGERHLKLVLQAGGRTFDAIEFGGWLGQPPPAAVHIAYRLDVNHWRDTAALQLLIAHRSDP